MLLQFTAPGLRQLIMPTFLAYFLQADLLKTDNIYWTSNETHQDVVFFLIKIIINSLMQQLLVQQTLNLRQNK